MRAAHDGTATIMQPQSLPLHGAYGPLELLALFSGPAPIDTRRRCRQPGATALADPRDAWRDALAAGVIEGTASAKLDVKLRPEAAQTRPAIPSPQAVTVLFRPDPYLLDGRFANNSWLQELPRPHTKLVWDNPLLLAPELAAKFGVTNGDRIAVVAGPERTEISGLDRAGAGGGCRGGDARQRPPGRGQGGRGGRFRPLPAARGGRVGDGATVQGVRPGRAGDDRPALSAARRSRETYCAGARSSSSKPAITRPSRATRRRRSCSTAAGRRPRCSGA